MKKIFTVVLILLSLLTAASQSKRPITFDDLIGMGRVTDPQISPDGKWIAFVVTYHNKVENRSNSNLYLIPSNGGEVRQLTSAKGTNNNPRWMPARQSDSGGPDGQSVAFVSTRDGESQIWIISVSGGEARKISHLSTGASGLMVSPDGKWFGFTSDVYPDCQNDDCNKKRDEEAENSKVKAKIFEHLPYRVWNAWKDGKRSHLFVMSASGGAATDVTPGEYDTPPIDLGGNWDYAFSPDSKEVAFARNPDAMVAISTNNELYVVPAGGGETKKITTNPGNDSQPLYSPDGKYIAYRAMRRAGFEADQTQLLVYDRASGSAINLTDGFDYSVNEVVWSPDSKALIFNAEEKGGESIFKVGVGSKKIEPVLNKGFNHDLRLSKDGKVIVFITESVNKPAELYRMDSDGKNIRQLTSINAERVAQLDLNPKEDFWFDGAGGTKVHGMLVKPPAFSAKGGSAITKADKSASGGDSAKKYPFVYLIHGGPQGEWLDQFHYRWSAQMFASRGYVVAMVNPRGSTGYGQKFTDEISKDWGGKVYEDLMNGVDYILKTYPFVDGSRMAAAGASYGGYMINWMAGHTDRFKCFVSHDGVYNPWSMYGTTEELWFVEWEFGGTPYKNPDLYNRWAPLMNAGKFKTPMLIVHGQQDFRVDVSEGFQIFTALQRQGVKSKMLYFPDEGHWVMKPGNAELWYKTLLDWIDENTKK